MTSCRCLSDVTEITFCKGTTHSSLLFHCSYGNRSMASPHLKLEENGIECMPCSPQIISEMLPEINTKEKCNFLIPIIHSENKL